MATSKKTITKEDLVSAVYDTIGYNKKFCKELVEEFLSILKEHLKKGQGVQIQGLGKFILRDKKARQGRNMQTGKPVMIPARRVLLFHASGRLKKLCK